MTTLQKIIKYIAIVLAIFLSVSIIGGIIGGLGLLTGIDEIADNYKDKDSVAKMETYELSQDITDIDIEISAADFEILVGEKLALESNISNLTVKDKNGKLVIEQKEKSFFNVNLNNRNIKLYVPKDFSFNLADIETGAADFNADMFLCNKLKLKYGAGNVNIARLYANKEADIEGGTGKFSIEDGIIFDLDFEMGVGNIDITASLYGGSEIICGVGNSKINLIGDKSEYCLKLEKGLGTIKVGGEKINNNTAYFDGENKVEINGGVGNIDVDFK